MSSGCSAAVEASSCLKVRIVEDPVEPAMAHVDRRWLIGILAQSDFQLQKVLVAHLQIEPALFENTVDPPEIGQHPLDLRGRGNRMEDPPPISILLSNTQNRIRRRRYQDRQDLLLCRAEQIDQLVSGTVPGQAAGGFTGLIGVPVVVSAPLPRSDRTVGILQISSLVTSLQARSSLSSVVI